MKTLMWHEKARKRGKKEERKKCSVQFRNLTKKCSVQFRNLTKLNEKHGSSYTPMQIRIWSESIVGGIHTSLTEAPTTSMFMRAGKGDQSKKRDQGNSSMSEALTQAALAISSALLPRPSLPSSQPVGTSPAKVIPEYRTPQTRSR